MELRMSLTLIFLLVALSSAVKRLPKEEELKVLENFYKSHKTIRQRSKAVVEQVLRRFYEVQEHNERFRQGSELFEQELNEFAGLSDEEFSSTRLGYKPPQNDTAHDDIRVPLVRASRSSLPVYWNWVDHGFVVQPVQNQGSCGSCYAFAAAGAMEGSMCRYFGHCVKLSEQEMMDCTAGCNGGWDHWVYEYTRVHGGATLRANTGYAAVRRKCDSGANPRQKQSVVFQHKVLPNDEFTIRHHLYHYGPMFVAFYVHSNFNSYRRGIIASESGKVLGGHAVLLTGYGVSDAGVPYWIAKNSWGSEWGEKGYFRILRGKNLMNFESWKISYPWMQ